MVKSNTLTFTVVGMCRITFRAFFEGSEINVKVLLDGVEYTTPFEKSFKYGEKHKVVAPSFVEPDKVFDSIVFRDIVSTSPEFEFTVPSVDAAPLLIYYRKGVPPAEIEVKVVNQTPSATVTVRAYSQGNVIGDYTLNPGDTKTVKALPLVVLTIADTKNVSPGKIVVFKETNDFTIAFKESGTATLVEIDFTWPPGYVNVKVTNNTPAATVRCVARSLTTGSQWIFTLKPGESFSFRGNKTIDVAVGKYVGESSNMRIVFKESGSRFYSANVDVELTLVEDPLRYGIYNPRIEGDGLNASLEDLRFEYHAGLGERVSAKAVWTGWKYAAWVIESGGVRKSWFLGYLEGLPYYLIEDSQKWMVEDLLCGVRIPVRGTVKHRIELYEDPQGTRLYGYTPWLVYDVMPEPSLDPWHFSSEIVEKGVRKYVDSVVVGGVEYVMLPYYGESYICSVGGEVPCPYRQYEQPTFDLRFEDLTREVGESPDYDYDEPWIVEIDYDVVNKKWIKFRAKYGGNYTTKIYYMDKLIYTFNPGTYTVEFEVPL
jgi:hypothetical protein